MKAWLWDGSKGVDHLRLADAPNPVPKEDEVVLEVHYTALNPADRYLIEKRVPLSRGSPASTRAGTRWCGDGH